MSEPTIKLDYDAILRDAHALRAETLANMMTSLVQFLRRKPVAEPVKG
jgi:hypothetical protein